MSSGIISSFELDHFISELELTNIEDIGTRKWFRNRENFLKLYQVAVLEAKSNREERVKNSFLKNNKLTILLFEIISLSVWKEKILPELIKLSPEPNHTFPTYFVIYNEVVLLGILQTILYHGSAFENLNERTVDLVDYAVAQIIKLDSNLQTDINDNSKISLKPYEEIKRQTDNINFTIGTDCISILRYVTENLDKLPLVVSARLYNNHDVPVVIAHLIENNVWLRKLENGKLYKYSEHVWSEWSPKDPALSHTECQSWLLLRQLLVNPNCASMYQFTSHRKDQLSKLIRYLHEDVLDQLSPLVDLKIWLQQMSMTAPQTHVVTKTPLIMEITKSYRDVLCEERDNSWKEIARTRAELLFYANTNDIQLIAKGLINDIDNMKQVSEKIQICAHCFSRAEKRCSKCKSVWYCSRQCQVKHWNFHKDTCCVN
ncbi:hypothetical protein AAG570_003773 [Ranatra chinensis]|uniref:MYND-type domain-containing protein n=1 Tax=Ranatra chinensis TaxID=642074 RepID=A0ABD0YMM8_9HEMI